MLGFEEVHDHCAHWSWTHTVVLTGIAMVIVAMIKILPRVLEIFRKK